MNKAEADTQNVTFNLPKPLVRQFRIYAATQSRSMTSLVTELIRNMVEKGHETEKARRRFLERLKNPPGRSAEGKITWTRDELYER